MVGMTILIALISILLMGAVLIQNPKGGGVDSTFGGAQANQMFGAVRTTDVIEKLTWRLATSMSILPILTAIYVTNSAGNSNIITG